VLCLLALAAAAPAPPAIVVVVPSGPLHAALRQVLLKPYAETTQTLLADPAWDGESLDALKSIAPDLALVDGAQLAAGCHAGQFRKLDWARLNRDAFLPQAATDCGAGIYLTATALAWDRDKFATAPSWSDFWDVARHPGRRALQRAARGTLEFALLADGVAAGDIYRTLRTQDGLDRAFRKLDQLKPYIQWWDQPAQPAQWLAAGRVLLTSAPAVGLVAAGTSAHRRLALQWVGSLTEMRYFVMPQNASHPAAAFLALATAADAVRQAQLAEAAGVGPTVRAAQDLLPAPARAQNPAAPENMQGALAIDESFWADNRARLDARFSAWLQK
jgi:putative spermidine/putrescine transport system substrate-binding protein